MDLLLHNLGIGLLVILQPMHLLMCFTGVLMGTLIGVLPGLGPSATVALLLPFTFKTDAASAIILLSGIYYGAMYGGSTTSILVNIPGESASVITCLDGYQMARKGRAGPALGMSAFGSFIGGSFSVLGLMLVAPMLTDFALKFGSPEYFALVLCGFSILINLGSGSKLKAIIAAFIGIFLAQIGTDVVSGQQRFTFGLRILYEGVPVVPMMMGLFGIAEVLENIEQGVKGMARDVYKTAFKDLLPNLQDWKACAGPILRGTVIGFFMGLLPGGGAVIASFGAYALEKRLSNHPETFGKGEIKGVAAPETANNAATGASFIPMLTLGIPATPVMAIMMTALIIQGVQPGPLLVSRSPDVFWGVVMSMYLGNIMLLVLNLPLIGMWVKLLKVPYAVLFPLIILFCLIGAYGATEGYEGIVFMLFFGVMGYVMRKFEYEPIPMVFALILGPLFERSVCQSLIYSHGNFGIFFRPPIALSFLVASIILFAFALLPFVKRVLKRGDSAGRVLPP